MKLPVAGTDNLVVQDLNGEVLIYDLLTNKSYCLNSTAVDVFNACDGQTTLEQLKVHAGLSEEIVFLSLDQLKKDNLLESDDISPFIGANRREVIKKIGLTSMVALPVISTLLAPTAINAASQGACVNPGGISPGSNVGSNRFTSIGTVCGDPSLAANGCNCTYAGQWCSNQAVGRSCIQDVSPSTGQPRLAVCNCKCA